MRGFILTVMKRNVTFVEGRCWCCSLGLCSTSLSWWQETCWVPHVIWVRRLVMKEWWRGFVWLARTCIGTWNLMKRPFEAQQGTIRYTEVIPYYLPLLLQSHLYGMYWYHCITICPIQSYPKLINPSTQEQWCSQRDCERDVGGLGCGGSGTMENPLQS